MIKNTKSKNAKEITQADHEWRNLSPSGLREVIVKYLAVSLALIGLIKPGRTGFAIALSNSGSRKALLQTNFGLFDTGAKIHSNYVTQTEVTKEMLSNEMELVTSTRPTSVIHYSTSITEAPHRTWMAYFDKAPLDWKSSINLGEILYSKRRQLTFQAL